MQALISTISKKGSQNLLLRGQAPLVALTRRFDGGYPWFPSMAENIPRDNPKIADDYLDETEVITRIMHVLHRYHTYDLATFDWGKPFGDQGVDSLDATALLTSIEEEFHTIFEDRVFENFQHLNQVKQFIVADHNAF